MVKNILFVFLVLLLNLFSVMSHADILFGVSTSSWQEKIPVMVAGTESDAMTSFSSLGVNVGYAYLYSQRLRYVISAEYLAGSADIQKLNNAITPRRNFNSYWLANKVLWRQTKSFSFGPSVVFNYRKLDGLEAALSSGLFMDFDYDLFENVRLTQSLGTMSDSKQLAYSIMLMRIF